MTIRNLEFLFRPKSVAVVGASEEFGSYGAVVLRNLIDGGFKGPILPVAVKHRSLFGIGAHARIDELPMTPDLAVICSVPEDVPRLVSDLGARGTKAVIVGSPGMLEDAKRGGAGLRQAMLRAARPHLMRILGPRSGGLMVPPARLNASFCHLTPLSGKLAFVSQSAAVASAVLDWAKSRGIGFSCALDLGESDDVDLADVLDYLATDPDTTSILIHFESLAVGRKFMSAARAAARNKPLVAIKGTRTEEGGLLSASHIGALLAPDDIYNAALRRAGIVRVLTMEGLFDAAAVLTRARPLKGERLTILANGTGLGRITADALRQAGGRLAALSPDAAAKLHALVPSTFNLRNPVNLPEDVSPARFAGALGVLLEDSESDSVLTIHAPTAFAASAEVAAATCVRALQARRNVFTCWVGGDTAEEARRVAAKQGVLSYESPEKAVGVFLGIANYLRNRDLLMQMPPSVATDFTPDADAARSVIAKALNAGRTRLSDREANSVLRAYGIPVTEAPVVRTSEQAVRVAQELGYPVDLKVLVADPVDDPEIGNMAYDLESAAEVLAAMRNLRMRVRERRAGARVKGFSLHRVPVRAAAHELLIAVATDPVFGPVIMFGQGGSGTEVARDLAVALPPLNMLLAHDLVSRTRVAERLSMHTKEPAVDQVAICLALIQVSQLISDFGEIVELEINPLLAGEEGVLALDATIRLAPDRREIGSRQFAIRPYPRELEQWLDWHGKRLLIRPIRPEDEIAHGEFLGSLDQEDARYRFFSTMRQLPRSQLARFTQIDYDREMAFVAIEQDQKGGERTIGEVRAVADPDNTRAEFAIVVRSEAKGSGLGRILIERIIDYCRSRGTQELQGETLAENERMQRLAQACGFTLRSVMGTGTVEMTLALRRGEG